MTRLGLAMGIVIAAACSPLDRADDLEPGTASGRAVGAAGTRLVKVDVDGVPALLRAESDGAFVVSGLTVGTWVVRLVDDDDGDGRADRGALQAFTVVASPAGRPAGVALGDIALSPTVSVGGVVVDGEDRLIPGARVVAFRTGADVGAGGLDGLRSEANTSTDDDGAFVLAGLIAGPVRVFAFSDRLASEVVLVPSSAPAGELRLRLAPIAGRAAFVEVRFGVDDQENGQGDIDVWIMPAGAPPTGNPTRVPLGLRTLLEVKPGVVDVFAVRVQQEGRGVLLGQVAVPDDVTGWGLMLLGPADPCAVGGDVDDDGVFGLPLVDFAELADESTPDDRRQREEERRSLWVACAATCLADARAICAADGQRFDCDDDDDGQADVSEDPACLGACGSTDLDLDRQCDRVDPAPRCPDTVSGDLCALPAPRALPEYLDP